MKLSGVDENRPLCTNSQTPVDNIHKQTILKYEHCIEECFMYPYHRGTFVPNALHSLFQNNYTTQYPSQQKVRGVIIKIFFSKNYLRAVANGFLSHFFFFFSLHQRSRSVERAENEMNTATWAKLFRCVSLWPAWLRAEKRKQKVTDGGAVDPCADVVCEY